MQYVAFCRRIRPCFRRMVATRVAPSVAKNTCKCNSSESFCNSSESYTYVKCTIRSHTLYSHHCSHDTNLTTTVMTAATPQQTNARRLSQNGPIAANVSCAQPSVCAKDDEFRTDELACDHQTTATKVARTRRWWHGQKWMIEGAVASA